MARRVRLCRPWRALARDRRGTSAIEFAVLALPLFLGMVGIVEFGRAYWVRNLLQFSVEEAGRYAMANTSASTTQVRSVVDTKLSGYGLNAGSLTVSATTSTVSGIKFMNISVQYQHSFATPLLSLTSVTLSSKASVPQVL